MPEGFRTTLMPCPACGGQLLVRAADVEQGYMTCQHTGCGRQVTVAGSFYFQEDLLKGLDQCGHLTDPRFPDRHYPLRPGTNYIGTATECHVCLPAVLHEGRRYVSRQHCTLTVVFDKWQGRLRYLLEDGTADGQKHSLNGTFLEKQRLQPGEQVDVADGQHIGLGPLDTLRLTHVVPSQAQLNQYRVETLFNPDLTQ